MPQTTFDQRVSSIHEKHRLLSDGVSYRIGPDGLITAFPQRRLSPRFPAKGMFLLLASAFAFKAALFIASGEAAYTTRLGQLAEGRTAEQALAWLMRPDPVSQGLASAAMMAYRATDSGLP